MSANVNPVAVIDGKPVMSLPSSLYVPPNALQIFLSSFEGPLDLLDYLIRRDNMDILDIPMSELTKQYLTYVEEIVESNIELVADYLLMAATLIEIKSRMLLPIEQAEEEEVDDPRAALVERLLKYASIRKAAEFLQQQDIVGRDLWPAKVVFSARPVRNPRIDVNSLHMAMLGVAERREMASELELTADTFSVREAMSHLFMQLRSATTRAFSHLLGRQHASRSRVGVFFQAVLEMTKEQLVVVEQKENCELEVTPRMGKQSRK